MTPLWDWSDPDYVFLGSTTTLKIRSTNYSIKAVPQIRFTICIPLLHSSSYFNERGLWGPYLAVSVTIGHHWLPSKLRLVVRIHLDTQFFTSLFGFGKQEITLHAGNKHGQKFIKNIQIYINNLYSILFW